MSGIDDRSHGSPPLNTGRGFVVSGQGLWEWWQWARQQADEAGISSTEADWLLQSLAGLTSLELRLASFRDRPQFPLPYSLPQLYQLWEQRIYDRVPVQYLAGKAPWRDFVLQVSPAVLIPRPETELLIDLAMMAEAGNGRQGAGEQGTRGRRQEEKEEPLVMVDWADLGTGSGAIALGLATVFPQASIHAVDYSGAALAIAQANAAAYQLGDRIQFYQGSWLEPLTKLKGKLRGIVSNPPYIPSQMVLDLQPEVTQHEPHAALDGGTDGLDCIRHLITTAPAYLQSGGIFLLEIMAGQAPMVIDLLHQNGHYEHMQVHKDLAGIERFVLAYRKLCTLEL